MRREKLRNQNHRLKLKKSMGFLQSERVSATKI